MPRSAEQLSSPGTFEAALLPLLLASPRVAVRDGRHPFDRIRMQKAVFLITQGAPSGIWANAYPYSPYNWGPYSAQLNEDLTDWQRRGFMILSYAGGTRYGRYTLTREGLALARQASTGVDPKTWQLLTDVRSWVTSKDFNSLLREVYEEFPEFATRSRWNDPR